MLSFKRVKLNQRGFGHHIILPVLVIAAVTAIGAYVINNSHAETLPTSTALSPPNNQIAYLFSPTYAANGNGIIHLVNPDGTNNHKLGPVPDYTSLNWSYDHSKLAAPTYLNKGDKGGYLDVVGLDNSYNQATPFGPYRYWQAQYGPNTSEIVYERTKDDYTGPDALYIVNTTSHEVRQLTDGSQHYEWDLSPDGNTILAEYGGTSRFYAVLINVKAGTQTQPVALPPTCNALDNIAMRSHVWAPDSKHFVVACVKNQDLKIYSVDNLTTPTRTIGLSQTDNMQEAAWSPDGKTLAFSALHDTSAGPYDYIGTVPADGSAPLTMVKKAPSINVAYVAVDWSPDGSKLLYDTNNFKSTKNPPLESLDVMNADGTNQVQLVAPTRAEIWAAWRP